ncbi:MAG: RNA polymerase sigma factor [FCB group bacterium]|nr:RNA polymerase sigma factor [FCB group bacterium]
MVADLDINTLYKIARNGDQASRDQLFDGLSARFRTFVRLRIQNEMDGEEIVQDALMAIAREYAGITIEISFAAWAYRVLNNRILAYLQTKKKRSQRTSRLPESESSAAMTNHRPDPELKRRLIDCFQKLGRVNRRYARILNLRYQGYQTEEICNKMDVRSSNLYSILSRARSLLELCLEKGDIT